MIVLTYTIIVFVFAFSCALAYRTFFHKPKYRPEITMGWMNEDFIYDRFTVKIKHYECYYLVKVYKDGSVMTFQGSELNYDYSEVSAPEFIVKWLKESKVV